MTCQQRVSKPSQAFVRLSGQKSGIGQLAACPFLAGCMWQSRSWQPPYGTMPLFSGLPSSSCNKSAGSLHGMWLQHSTTARAMLPSLWLRAIPRTLLSCLPQPPRLPCSPGSSPAHCSLLKGVWGWWRCLHKSRPSRPRWCLACLSLSG
jgi:hypothetical protein